MSCLEISLYFIAFSPVLGPNPASYPMGIWVFVVPKV